MFVLFSKHQGVYAHFLLLGTGSGGIADPGTWPFRTLPRLWRGGGSRCTSQSSRTGLVSIKTLAPTCCSGRHCVLWRIKVCKGKTWFHISQYNIILYKYSFGLQVNFTQLVFSVFISLLFYKLLGIIKTLFRSYFATDLPQTWLFPMHVCFTVSLRTEKILPQAIHT